MVSFDSFFHGGGGGANGYDDPHDGGSAAGGTPGGMTGGGNPQQHYYNPPPFLLHQHDGNANGDNNDNDQNYEEHNADRELVCTSTQSQSFPMKLYCMLNDSATNRTEWIVSWLPNGRSFKIHRRDEFMDQICPLYFNQSKYKSFQRQTLLYGFEKKISLDLYEKNSYSHPLFIRGNEDSVSFIRRVPNGTKQQKEEYKKMVVMEYMQKQKAKGSAAAGTPMPLLGSSNAISSSSSSSGMQEPTGGMIEVPTMPVPIIMTTRNRGGASYAAAAAAAAMKSKLPSQRMSFSKRGGSGSTSGNAEKQEGFPRFRGAEEDPRRAAFWEKKAPGATGAAQGSTMQGHADQGGAGYSTRLGGGGIQREKNGAAAGGAFNTATTTTSFGGRGRPFPPTGGPPLHGGAPRPFYSQLGFPLSPVASSSSSSNNNMGPSYCRSGRDHHRHLHPTEDLEQQQHHSSATTSAVMPPPVVSSSSSNTAARGRGMAAMRAMRTSSSRLQRLQQEEHRIPITTAPQPSISSRSMIRTSTTTIASGAASSRAHVDKKDSDHAGNEDDDWLSKYERIFDATNGHTYQEMGRSLLPQVPQSSHVAMKSEEDDERTAEGYIPHRQEQELLLVPTTFSQHRGKPLVHQETVPILTRRVLNNSNNNDKNNNACAAPVHEDDHSFLDESSFFSTRSSSPLDAAISLDRAEITRSIQHEHDDAMGAQHRSAG
eukprot:CAMPEP_0119572366 /NCGR_PEP_ID=MMETSP1352-20130426/44577_1 /TAXON_ID=265584 /ORGANISM="Stauroneis constricta, Strain CCMP1120" /LENGTH=709 /DNA_ID=CAMNT_0007622051 /DNA_START=3736 /DNA_END=5865 /DNA_ORIENTATION=-